MTRALALLALAAACAGCESGPAFPVPPGPPAQVALDARFPVYVLGKWTIDGFDEALGIELAKYNIRVVPPRAEPDFVALIDLGHWSYHQVIDVDVLRHGDRSPAGRVRVPDLRQDTLDAAAAPVAALIARAVWYPPDPRARAAPSVE